MSADLAIEITAVALGVVYVLLAARPSVWCWPFGIAGSALSVVVFAQARLYSEVLLNVAYVGLGVAGWIGWHGRADDRPIGEAPLHHHLLGCTAAALAALALGGAMGLLTDAARPLVDALTTTFALWATVLTTRKARSSWAYWVGIDAVSAWLYASRGLWVYSGLMAAYTLVAAVAWVRWRGAAEPHPAPAPR